MNRRKNRTPTVESLTIPADYDPKTTGVSQSLFKRFLRCRYEFLFAVNLWRLDKGGATTGFGSIAHETLDKIYTKFSKRGRLPTPKTIDEWIEEYCEKKRDEMLGIPADRLLRYKAIVHLLLVEYMTHYREDFREKEWLGCEEVFDEIEPNSGVRMRGKIDGRFRLKKGLWLMETKTMSRVEEDKLTARLSLDLQNLYYITAGEMKFGEPIRGVLYNVIRNPAFRKVDEPLPDLLKRLRIEVRRNPEHYFLRYECVYNERDKSQYLVDLSNQFEDFKELCNGAGRVYRNHSACDHKYPCDYMHACACGKLAGYKKTKSLFTELDG
jgi:PD-(D/E)XK nuclease superfamily